MVGVAEALVRQGVQASIPTGSGERKGALGSGQLQDREAPPAVPNGHDLAKIQLLDHLRDIVCILRPGIRPLGLVALPVATQVDGHDPVPPGEVLGLRDERRSIACPPMHEHEGWLARAPVLVSELNPLMDNRRHDLFSFFTRVNVSNVSTANLPLALLFLPRPFPGQLPSQGCGDI
jgi:hypothetical protein